MAIGETGGIQPIEVRDPDVRLMLQIRDDVPGAFEVMIERYQHRLVGLLAHLVGGTIDEAEALTREVLLRIYRARKGYKPKARFSIWVFTIANNLAMNHLRGKGRSPTLATDSPRPRSSGARDGSPSSQARQVEPSEVVREALGVLGEDQMLAVLLNKFEAMSYADIAEVMGRSELAVKSLLARARNQLRERLEPHFKTGPRAT